MYQIMCPIRPDVRLPLDRWTHLAGILLLLVSAAAGANDDPRYVAVRGLGALNGVALQCKYIDQVRRMKSAVVIMAPKQRSFGLAFDQATNDAFLDFIARDAVCPSHAAFERHVGHQIDAMQAAFAVPRSARP
jgi:hypothetical protein